MEDEQDDEAAFRLYAQLELSNRRHEASNTNLSMKAATSVSIPHLSDITTIPTTTTPNHEISTTNIHANHIHFHPNTYNPTTTSSRYTHHRLYASNNNSGSQHRYRYKISSPSTNAPSPQTSNLRQIHNSKYNASHNILNYNSNHVIDEEEEESKFNTHHHHHRHTDNDKHSMDEDMLPLRVESEEIMMDNTIYMEFEILRIWNIDEIEETFNGYITLTLYELLKDKHKKQDSMTSDLNTKSRDNTVYWKMKNIAPEFRISNAISQNIEQDTVSVIR